MGSKRARMTEGMFGGVLDGYVEKSEGDRGRALFDFIMDYVRGRAASAETMEEKERWGDCGNMFAGFLFAENKTAFVESGRDLQEAEKYAKGDLPDKSRMWDQKKLGACLRAYNRARKHLFPGK